MHAWKAIFQPNCKGIIAAQHTMHGGNIPARCMNGEQYFSPSARALLQPNMEYMWAIFKPGVCKHVFLCTLYFFFCSCLFRKSDQILVHKPLRNCKPATKSNQEETQSRLRRNLSINRRAFFLFSVLLILHRSNARVHDGFELGFQ